MKQSINRQTGHRLDARLVGDVLAMGVHRMDGDIQPIGNLLAAQPLAHQHKHFGLSIAQLVTLICRLGQIGHCAFTQQLRHMVAGLTNIQHRLERSKQ